MDEAIWNVLHDGGIVAIDGLAPGALRLTIEIAYLCGWLPTQGTSLVVTLDRAELFEYRPYQEPAVSDPAAILEWHPEILSAGPSEEGLLVECAGDGSGGLLALRYASATASTIEGQVLSQAELESAAEGYWTDWERRTTRS